MNNYGNRYVWLDLIRGLSAIAVCAQHVRTAIFIRYNQIETATLIHKIFYFCTGLGHQSVMVFFVLSGFFVGGSVLKKSNSFSFKSYNLTRITRLWIVLIPSLIMTLIIDSIIASYNRNIIDGYYYQIWNSGPPISSYSLSLKTFIANLIFLQTIFTPVFGTNGPLWSLANEFWYYILFPLLAIAIKVVNSGEKKFIRLVYILISVCILYMTSSMIIGFVIWLLGVVSFVVSQRMKVCKRPRSLLLSLLFFSATLVISKSQLIRDAISIDTDLFVGISFAVVCVFVATWPNPTDDYKGWIAKICVGLSEFSYSLYLSHFPFVMILGGIAYGGHQIILNGINLLIYFFWVLATLVIGAIFWYLIERHTIPIRNYVFKVFMGS